MSTIQEVSKVAGVSTATVSRTLAAPHKVSSETRKKVFAAIEEVNYQPNMMARNLRTKKSFAILVLVPDIANPFFSRVIRGIEQVALGKGYSVLLGNTDGLSEREAAYAGLWRRRQADGVIQLNNSTPPGLHNAKGKSTPLIVNVCEGYDIPDVPHVQVDNTDAARRMTDHLLALGHRRIAFVVGPPASPLTRDRLEGCRAALGSARVPFDETLVAQGDFHFQSGREAAIQLTRRPARPTALFCFNDEMAIGAIEGLRSFGLRVPDDISVAGFDDIEFAKFSAPPLTTISQPKEQMGRLAVSVLLEMIEGRMPESLSFTLATELIVRASTAPPQKL